MTIVHVIAASGDWEDYTAVYVDGVLKDYTRDSRDDSLYDAHVNLGLTTHYLEVVINDGFPDRLDDLDLTNAIDIVERCNNWFK